MKFNFPPTPMNSSSKVLIVGILLLTGGLPPLVMATEAVIAQTTVAQSDTRADVQKLEGEGSAQTGLGEANFELGKMEEAIAWLKKVQASYQALGDEAQGQVLAARIEEMKKKLSNSSS